MYFFLQFSSSKAALKVVDRQTIKSSEDSDSDESNEKEISEFDHVCNKCSHVVAKHAHEFWVEDGYQEYRMECLLCGLGQDSISVNPKDPKKLLNNF